MQKQQQQQSPQQIAAQQQKRQQEEEMRLSILQQILSTDAHDRLAKLKLVKPEKVVGIENSLIKAAQSGMLRNRISEQELVAMLEKDSEKKTEAKITFKRRGIDDEW